MSEVKSSVTALLTNAKDIKFGMFRFKSWEVHFQEGAPDYHHL